jgi:hypothetical protein
MSRWRRVRAKTGQARGPNASPDVRAAYAAYLDAWVDLANMPGRSERSVAEGEAAGQAQYRLFEADRAHHDAWHNANRFLRPEMYQGDSGIAQMTPGDWQAKYPLLDLDQAGSVRQPAPGRGPDLEAGC